MAKQQSREIELNGQKIKLNPLPPSKKGAKKLGSRIHIKGLGTVYVLVYETAERPGRPANPTPPRAAESKPPEREQDDSQQMLAEILKRMNERLDSLEDTVTRPVSRPSRPHHNGDPELSPPHFPPPSAP